MSLFYGESSVMKNQRFQGHQIDAAIRENRDHLGTLGDRNLPVNKAYDKAIGKLETLRKQNNGATLSDQQRNEMRTATQNVRDARFAAAKGELRDSDRAEMGREIQDQHANRPKAELVQNKGEPGVYRDPGSGEVVRRDTPEAKSINEQDKVQSNQPYAKQGRYRNGASDEDVRNGKSVYREGDKGDGIKRLQERLVKAGFDVGKKGADGYWGPETEKAARQAMMVMGSKRVSFGREDLGNLERMLPMATKGDL